MKNKNINYALVEVTRPPIYTAMKYWGKKPHNIWRSYIDCYTPTDGKFLDPFCGSGISAFESVKLGRTAYALDLNPLSSFMIEVLTSQFEDSLFKKYVNNIFNDIEQNKFYQQQYKINCKCCGRTATIVNFKWNNNQIYEVAVECNECNTRYTIEPQPDEKQFYISNIKLDDWYPTTKFQNSDSFGECFKKAIGGTDYSCLWTKRNLYILSKIFKQIEDTKDKDIKLQLLFGFIQTLHLTSKMCVPRSKKTNRDFSTSWGRAAYICSKKQMEMNPLLLFKNSCLGKQSVESALKDVKKYLGKHPIICDITKDKKNNADLYYGICDIKEISNFISKESIDFILTDPPYGGLVKYFDLSSIWLVWLSKIDKKYWPDFANELTVKNKDLDKFYSDFLVGLKSLYGVLKSDGRIVFTFNNKDLQIWNVFLNAIVDAGFKIEKVIHQQNKRTGESNVKSTFGTSSSDFYIRCIKAGESISCKEVNDAEYEKIIINTTKKIIKQRNEPTNYDILFAGIIGELSSANLNIKNCNSKIESILKEHLNKEFIIIDDNGPKWFLNNWKSSGPTLSKKVKLLIHNYIIDNPKAIKDSILSVVFEKFPNGLTPDPILIKRTILEELKKENYGNR